MIARILRLIWLAQVALGLALAAWGWAAGAWGPLGALAVAVVLPFALEALFIGLQFVLAARVNRRTAREPRPLGVLQGLRTWLAETGTSIVTFDWRQAWRADAAADLLMSEPRRGVVFVHGYFCNRGLWRPHMARLRVAGVPHVAVTLEPAFGSITAYGQQLHAAVERLRRATGQRPLLVCHSMGGLAARAYLAQCGASAVHGVIAIGTPHHGAAFAALGSGHNAAQMRTGSDWLRDNAAALGTQGRARFINFYSNGDNIVSPYDSAMLDGADNRYVPACGHMRLIFTPAVWQAIWAQLQAD